MNIVNEALEASVKENQCQKIISFLFLEAFKNVLGSSSLEYFREEFCEAEKRTVILIFGFKGCLRSELLVVCGQGYESELDDFIDKPLSHDVMRKVAETLAFRESHCLWLFPTPWLIPDIFDVNMGRNGHNRMVEEIYLQFKSFKALLSVIFLADRVEIENDYVYRVEYKGYGRVLFPVSRALLLSNESHIESLYKLYKDAYDRFSSDKLEIAQQFLSLMAGIWLNSAREQTMCVKLQKKPMMKHWWKRSKVTSMPATKYKNASKQPLPRPQTV